MIERITLGDLTLNTLRGCVELGGRQVNLTPQELKAFRLLLLCGRASHTDIYFALYGISPECQNDAYDVVGPLIFRLRRKFQGGLIARGRIGTREYILSAEMVGIQ